MTENADKQQSEVPEGEEREELAQQGRLEQTEQGGEASMKLLWSSPSIAQQVVPASRLYAS